MKRILYIFLTGLLLQSGLLHAQAIGFSLTTDLDIQRNFRKGQQFWAEGQTIQLQVHFTKKNSLYTWASYFSNGKINSTENAIAKSPLTLPQTISYRNRSLIRFKHISVGGKHYFKGDALQETGWSIYGQGGFGVILGRVINSRTPAIDSSLYVTPITDGKSNFKRLTLDLGLGWEKSLGGTIYCYTDIRCWIPTSDYPSPYLSVNRRAPLAGMLNLGIRILFD